MGDRASARSNSPVLSVEKVSHSYGSNVALVAVDLELRSGSATGLVGRNGSGKTTLLRILSGSLNQTQGQVKIRAGARRCLVPDRDEVLPADMTPRSYLAYMRRLGQGDQLPVSEALDLVGLSSVSNRNLSTLSRGYRQRVLIAQGLLPRPEVLLLDEPFNSLDPIQIEEIAKVVRGLSWRPAILISSHVMGHLKGIVDAFAVLRSGAIVRSGPLEAFYGRTNSDSLSVAVIGSEKAVREALQAPLKLEDVRHRAGVVEFTVTGEPRGGQSLVQAVVTDLGRTELRLISIEERSMRLLEML